VICSRCRDGLEPSPWGDACDPVASPLPDWLIPVVVVGAVVLSAAVIGGVVILVLRCRRSEPRQRPPLPRLEELDVIPADRPTKKRRSILGRDRYTATPNRSQRVAEQVTLPQ